MVIDGVKLLAHRPLEVSPFNEDEPQVLRHASTREAFVRLVHHYLLLSQVKKHKHVMMRRRLSPSQFRTYHLRYGNIVTIEILVAHMYVCPYV